jgi:hypothetical protein
VNLNMKFVVYLLVLLTLGPNESIGMTAHDICAEFDRAYVSRKGYRDGGLAVSIIVPRHAIRTTAVSPDSEAIQWKSEGVLIGYSYYLDSRIFDPSSIGDKSEICPLHPWKVVITKRDKGKNRGVLLQWAEVPHPGFGFSLYVSAATDKSLLSVVVPLIHSVAFINDATKLRVVSISKNKDRVSATIENEIGLQRNVSIGDIITRDFGKVIDISPNSITVEELVQSGNGDWEGREVILPIKE